MKIKSFTINGFGIFSGMTVDSLAPGLNLFVGDNEAGKSTLLAFFRSIMFGFESGANKDYAYKPLNGGEHGGLLCVTHGINDEQYIIERKPGKAQGNVSVMMPSGVTFGEDALASLLPGVTKDLYKNVFAFSLDELQNATSLSAKAVSSRIYSFDAMGGLTSAIDVYQKLSKEMDDLYTPRAMGKPIPQALSSLAVIDKKLREIKSNSGEYDAKQAELARIDAELDTAQQNLDDLRRDAAHFSILEKAWPNWESLVSLRAELQIVPAIDSFPEDGIARLERYKEKLDDLNGRLLRAETQLSKDQDRISSYKVDETLLKNRDAIEALARGLAYYEDSVRTKATKQAELKSTQTALDDALRQIGTDWTEQKVLGFDTSVPVRSAVREWASRLAEAKANTVQSDISLASAERDFNEKESTLRLIEAQLYQNNENSHQVSPEAFEEAVRTLRRAITRRDSLSTEWDMIQKELEATREQQKGFIRNRKLTICLTAVALIASGLAAVSYKLSQPAFFVLIAITVASFFALASTLGKRSVLSAAKDFSNNFDSAIQVLENNLRQCQSAEESISSEIETACEVIGRTISTQDELETLEAELSKNRDAAFKHWKAADDVSKAKSQLELSSKRVAEARKIVEAANNQLEILAKSWNNWLAELGLPSQLAPETALDLLSQIDIAREKTQTKSTREIALSQTTTRIEQFEAESKSVFVALNWTLPDVRNLAAVINQLSNELTTSIENTSKQNELQTGVQRLITEIESLRTEATIVESEIAALLLAGESPDEETFRRRAVQADERTRLEREIRSFECNIDMLAGSEHRESIQNELSDIDFDTIQGHKASISMQINALEVKIAEIRETKGRLIKEIKDIEQSDAVAEALSAEQSIKAKLNSDAAEWAKLAICRHVLSIARERYEREKQPRVMQNASEFLKTITNNRYERIVSPLGQQSMEVVTPEHIKKDPKFLSRGTREQLYLSVRFGLIKEYSSSAEPLPVMMDDVLVNFDPSRADAAAKTILQLAENNQIFFFTCHPETAERFRKIDPSIRQYRVSSREIIVQ